MVRLMQEIFSQKLSSFLLFMGLKIENKYKFLSINIGFALAEIGVSCYKLQVIKPSKTGIFE